MTFYLFIYEYDYTYTTIVTIGCWRLWGLRNGCGTLCRGLRNGCESGEGYMGYQQILSPAYSLKIIKYT